jgi:hypothetical protein
MLGENESLYGQPPFQTQVGEPPVSTSTCHCDHGHIVLLEGGYTVLQVGIPKDGTETTISRLVF